MLNSLLFGNYIRQRGNANKGLNIKENVEKFFYDGSPTIAQNFLNWLEDIQKNSPESGLVSIVKDTPLSSISTELISGQWLLIILIKLSLV